MYLLLNGLKTKLMLVYRGPLKIINQKDAPLDSFCAMRLPLSSSLPSVGSSDDGILAKQLLLAGTNAEFNRASCSGIDKSDTSSSPRTLSPHEFKAINFNPEVSVRFIRRYAKISNSGVSDAFGSFRSSDSPIAPDATQSLKDDYVDSEDEEFDRFYRSMRPGLGISNPGSTERSRRFSLDQLEENLSDRTGGRARSVSCDEYLFQSMKMGG
jgi:hypothetical protein